MPIPHVTERHDLKVAPNESVLREGRGQRGRCSLAQKLVAMISSFVCVWVCYGAVWVGGARSFGSSGS